MGASNLSVEEHQSQRPTEHTKKMSKKAALGGLLAAYGSDDEESSGDEAPAAKAPLASRAGSPSKRGLDAASEQPEKKKRKIIVDDLQTTIDDDDDRDTGPKVAQPVKASSIFAALPAPKSSKPVSAASTGGSGSSLGKFLPAPRTVKAASASTAIVELPKAAADSETDAQASLPRKEPETTSARTAKPKTGSFFSLPTKSAEPTFGPSGAREAEAEEEAYGVGPSLPGQDDEEDQGVAASAAYAYSYPEQYAYSDQYSYYYDGDSGAAQQPGVDEYDPEQLRRLQGRSMETGGVAFREIRQADQTQKSEWEQELALEMTKGDRPSYAVSCDSIPPICDAALTDRP